MFKSLGIACSLVAVQSCGEPLNDDKKKGLEAAINKRQAENNADIEFDVAGKEDVESVNNGDAGADTKSDKNSQKEKPSQDAGVVGEGVEESEKTNSANSGNYSKKVNEDEREEGIEREDFNDEDFGDQNVRETGENSFNEDGGEKKRDDVDEEKEREDLDLDETESKDDSEDIPDNRDEQQASNDVVDNPNEVVDFPGEQEKVGDEEGEDMQ